MSWRKLLDMELAGVGRESYVEPDTEVKRGETVLGEVSDDAKKIYTLSKGFLEAGARYMIDAQFGRDDKMREGAAMKAIELRMKADTLMEIFWICVHEEFGHWGENIGVRKGFKAVCYESPMISIIDVLRNLGK